MFTGRRQRLSVRGLVEGEGSEASWVQIEGDGCSRVVGEGSEVEIDSKLRIKVEGDYEGKFKVEKRCRKFTG